MHAYRYSDHEQQVAALARELGFAQVSASHEVSPLIKLVGRGDTTVVDSYLSPILRRYVSQVAGDLNAASLAARAASKTRLMFMMSSGGLTAAELFRGKDAILSGPAAGVVGMAETGRAAGFYPAHRLRHGRHLDRRVAFRRRIRARLRDRSRRRAHARADDADPHGRGRRRLDPAFRRRAVSRRPGFRRRQSRPEMLSPRRPAGGDRRQCDGRQAHPGFLSEDFRPAAEPAARRRRGARGLRGDGEGDRRRPQRRTGRRRFHQDRRREHGERDQEDFGAARLRRDALCAQLLRRRRRPARLPGRRCARHGRAC